MSLPPGLSTVTVACGPYTDASGAPYAGTVTFEPSTPVVWTATGQVVLDGGISVALGSTGAGQVVLPASDDAGLSPAGFTYRVSFDLTAPGGERTGVRYPFSILLPHAAPSVVLDRLSPVPTTTGSTVVAALGPLATLPVPGAPSAGKVLTATSGAAASWQTPSVAAAVSDATTGSKGVVQLAGDLGGTAAAPTVPGLAGKAADGAVVHNTGAETIAGVKTFTSAPVVPSGAFPESAVSGLVTDLAAKTPTTRAVTAGAGLAGGGDLSADRTLAVAFGSTAGTAAQGNDSRIAGALQAANNLSEVTAATARANLGLGTAATQPSTAFDGSGAAAAAQAASLQKSSNLSDLASAATARTNLGLGAAATLSTAQIAADSALTTVFGNLAGSNTWTGTQNFTGATVTGISGSAAQYAHSFTVQQPRPGTSQYVAARIPGVQTAQGMNTQASGTAFAVPLMASAAFTANAIAAGAHSNGTGTPLIRLGIYADDSNFWPGALAVDAGTIDGTTIGAMSSLTISKSILAYTVYWLVLAYQGTITTTPNIKAAGAVGNVITGLLGLGSTTAATLLNATDTWFTVTGITGALPGTFPARSTATLATSSAPVILLGVQ